jgi:hypothetical protein
MSSSQSSRLRPDMFADDNLLYLFCICKDIMKIIITINKVVEVLLYFCKEKGIMYVGEGTVCVYIKLTFTEEDLSCQYPWGNFILR